LTAPGVELMAETERLLRESWLIALEADALTMHADPADRFIVATALRLEAPVLTKDRLPRDLRWVKTMW
jgi:PIN domain nuclease of toxin-antitoxin system